MKKYRIAKVATGEYVVQERFLWFFWNAVRRDSLSIIFMGSIIYFSSEQGALEFINGKELTEKRIKNRKTIVEIIEE